MQSIVRFIEFIEFNFVSLQQLSELLQAETIRRWELGETFAGSC